MNLKIVCLDFHVCFLFYIEAHHPKYHSANFEIILTAKICILLSHRRMCELLKKVEFFLYLTSK